jgi:DNA-binding NarL/FixJ family response regulator
VDDQARTALEALVRGIVDHDLDELQNEAEQLRERIAVLERAAGLTTDRLSRDERREAVRTLRAQGYSSRTIARAVGVHPVTVKTDVRAMQLPRPRRVVGADGVVRRYDAPQ